jgi:hypothetical protein
MVQVEARRAIKRAARVTTTMPTMTQPPSVCGSVLCDSYVNGPVSSRWFGVPTGSAFTRYFFSRFHTASTKPTPRRSRTSPGAWSVLSRYDIEVKLVIVLNAFQGAFESFHHFKK